MAALQTKIEESGKLQEVGARRRRDCCQNVLPPPSLPRDTLHRRRTHLLHNPGWCRVLDSFFLNWIWVLFLGGGFGWFPDLSLSLSLSLRFFFALTGRKSRGNLVVVRVFCCCCCGVVFCSETPLLGDEERWWHWNGGTSPFRVRISGELVVIGEAWLTSTLQSPANPIFSLLRKL